MIKSVRTFFQVRSSLSRYDYDGDSSFKKLFMLPGHISLDGLHSLFDSTPNTIVLVGITISRPTDKEHPYGHASSRRLPL
jgi:hypothetical protein